MQETIALFERMAGRTLDVRTRPAVPGDQRRTKADTTRIRARAGWEPQVELEDGVERQWRWASDRVAAR